MKNLVLLLMAMMVQLQAEAISFEETFNGYSAGQSIVDGGNGIWKLGGNSKGEAPGQAFADTNAFDSSIVATTTPESSCGGKAATAVNLAVEMTDKNDGVLIGSLSKLQFLTNESNVGRIVLGSIFNAKAKTLWDNILIVSQP